MGRIELYEHNQKAYDAALSLMNETGKAAVIHPTGTGKSFIGFKLAEEHPDSNICWLSPSEYIYKTQIENLKAVADGYEPANITFMTYAKLMMTDTAEIEEIQPDYIILDEFHRCGAAEWGKGVERLLSVYPDVPILGLSATNIRYLDNQRDMADELFDGNVASEMTLGEAIVRDILLAPTYITSIYSYQKDLEKYQHKVRKSKNKVVRHTAQKYLDELRRTLTKADGLDVIFDKHIKDRTGKIIIFCSSVNHMNEMIDRVPEWFYKVDKNPHIYRVYAEDSNSDKEFAAFKKDESDSLKLLYCVSMLNEGVHIENVSGVILFRPTVSPIIYKQQIGRALSASKDKQPVIFDIVNNFENLYSIGSIEEEMQEAVVHYNWIGNGESIINSKFQVIDEVRDCRKLFNELQESLSASWDMMFEAASHYYEKFGDLLVPHKYKTDDGWSLGTWITTQRRVKSGSVAGIMTEERIEKLDSIGMVWDNIAEYCFEKNYGYALQYYKENCNLDVMRTYRTQDGFALGNWIGTLRRKYKSNETGMLTKERIELLNKLGMIWDKNDCIFEKHISALKKYYDEYGNFDVKFDYKTSDGLNLGSWILTVRRKYQTGKLTESQIKRLNKIGMAWIDSFDKYWQNCYEKAVEYHKKYGNIDVPATYKTEDNTALGKWIADNRINKKTGKSEIALTNERRKKLDKLGMIWNAEDSWDIRYNLLCEYKKMYCNINIPQSYCTKNKIWLGKWLDDQRKTYRGEIKGKGLAPEQIEKLNAIGVKWDYDYDSELFEEYMDAANAFYIENKHLNVPNKYVGKNGKRLDNWIRLQRKKLKENKLKDGQIERLSALGMAWELDDSWENNFSALTDYVKEKGNADVPYRYVLPNGTDLGKWLSRQRAKYNGTDKGGLLTAEQIKRLTDLGVRLTVKDLWAESFGKALKYYQAHGNVNVSHPFRTDDDFDLGYWIYLQRKLYHNGKLTQPQIDMLNSIQINWISAEEQRWETNYERLILYKQEYENLKVPVTYRTKDGFMLGGWVKDQRKKRTAGKLSDEQIKKLDAIYFIWDDKISDMKRKSEYIPGFEQQESTVRI